MAKKYKIQDTLTGKILEVDEKDLGQYGLSTPTATPQPKVQPQTQQQGAPIQQQSLASAIGGFLGQILDPFVKTGKTIGGAGFEVGRAGLSALGNKDVYINQKTRETVQNPFLSEQELQKYSTDPLGALTDQLKASAGVASFAVPFGRGANILSKILLPGAAVGGLQGISEKDATLQSVAGNTVLGAGGAGALRGLLKLGKVGSKAATQTLPERLMSGVFKEPIKDTRAAIKGGESLGKQALQRGVKGLSDESIYQGAVGKINALEDSLQTTLKSSTRIVPLADIKQAVKPLIQKYTNSGNLSAVNNITNRLEALEQAHGKSIPVSVANEVKRSLYEEVGNNYGKVATEGIEGLKAIAKSLKQSIASKVPGVNKINEELAFNGRVRDSMVDKLARGGRNNMLGLTDALIAGGGLASGLGAPAFTGIVGKKFLGSTGGKTILANILNKAGKGGSNLNLQNPLFQYLTGQGAARAGAGLPKVFSSQADTDNLSDTYSEKNQNEFSQNNLPPASSIQQPVNRQITSEQMQKVFMAQAQGLISKKTADSIKSAYDVQEEAIKNAGGGKLSAQQQKDAINAKSGLRNLDLMEKRLESDPKTLIKASLPGSIGARDYVRWGREVSDVYTRLRTGAALNDREIEFYDAQLPKLLDINNPKDIKAALKIFRDLFNDFAGGQRGAAIELNYE